MSSDRSKHGQLRRPAGARRRRPRRLAGGERRAARVEPAAGRDPGRVRRLAGEHDRLDVLDLGHDRQQRPGVRVLRVARAPPRSGPARRSGPGTSPRSGRRCSRPGRGRASRRATVSPSSSRSRSSSARISPRTEASSADTGSSATMTSGSSDERTGDDHALALAAGQLVRVAQEEPLRRPQPGPRQRLGDALAARRRGTLWMRRPSATASYTVCRGLSAPVGSCSTSWTRRRYALQRRGAVYVSGWPGDATAPAVGSTSPRIARASVVLPQPDSPTSARISPGATARSTPSTARWPAAARGRGRSTPRLVHLQGRHVRRRVDCIAPRRSRDAAVAAHGDARRPRAAAPAGAQHAARRRSRSGPSATGQRGWNVQPGRQVARERAGRRAARAGRSRDAGSPMRRERAAERPAVRVQRVARRPSSAGPSSTIRPAYMTATRSQVDDEHRQVVADDHHADAEVARPASVIRSSTWACTMTSSAVVGSSAMTSRGRQASAIAIITRCFCPPESWCG